MSRVAASRVTLLAVIHSLQPVVKPPQPPLISVGSGLIREMSAHPVWFEKGRRGPMAPSSTCDLSDVRSGPYFDHADIVVDRCLAYLVVPAGYVEGRYLNLVVPAWTILSRRDALTGTRRPVAVSLECDRRSFHNFVF